MSSVDVKTFTAAGVIAPKSVVKFTGNRGEVAQATAQTDKIAGVADLGAGAAGQVVDVAEGDWFEVTAGGAISAGDLLTANAAGLAVVATKPGAGLFTYCFGRAEVPAAAGDIFLAFLSPSVIAG